MKTKDLTVYPVNIDETNLNTVDKYPLLKIPFFMVILGRVAAGKSTLLNSLTLSPRFYGDDFQIKILISPTARSDPAMVHIIDHFQYVFEEYSEALLDEIVSMVENDEEPNRYLLVMDDAITGQFKQSKSGKVDAFSSLVTKYRHIKNNASGQEGMLSIILTLQYFKFLSVITRTMASGIVIAGQFPETELNKIAEAYDFLAPGGSRKKFLENYKKCRQNPYDVCFLNVNSLEMRRNFDDEIIYSRKQEIEEKSDQDPMPSKAQEAVESIEESEK
jgi:hypothetical protein